MVSQILNSAIALIILNSLIACNSKNNVTAKNQKTMFTLEQIKHNMTQVKTGADFPILASKLKKLGVTHYETKIIDGSSIFFGENGHIIQSGPNYDPIYIADQINLQQLQSDILDHQRGKSDYMTISNQSASNGIYSWQVNLESMTCTYVDKNGNNIWIEKIPHYEIQIPTFTVEQLKEAHSKVKTGADFPFYIKEIKELGVTHYETYVNDGQIDYHGGDNYTVQVPAKYDSLTINPIVNKDKFITELKAHQEGKTDFITFINMCASTGIAKWQIHMGAMTCTYFDRKENSVLVENIPQ